MIVVAIVSLAMICFYFFSFKNTISAIVEYHALLEKKEAINDAPQKVKVLETEIRQMEHLLVDADGIDVEQILLEKTTDFCKKSDLVLIEFPQTSYSEYQDYHILTNKVVLEGGFKKQILFIYDSEKNNKTGMVASVHLSKKKDIRTKRESLLSYIYFQNIKLKTK